MSDSTLGKKAIPGPQQDEWSSLRDSPSARPDTAVDAITLLKSQHREVERLFSAIVAVGSADKQAREELFLELAQNIEGHSKIEEKFFYPAGKSVDEGMTLEACEEHALVHELIKKIALLPPDDPTFMAKIAVLRELIDHHVKDEECDYFPEVRQALGDERILLLGKQMAAEFSRLMQVRLVRKMPKRAAASRRTSLKKASKTVSNGERGGSGSKKKRPLHRSLPKALKHGASKKG